MTEPVRSPALVASGVARDFRSGFWLRSRRVLGPFDLAVEPGRAVGLMGPNGSGKSTFLRLAAGVDRPSAGSVRVLGLDPASAAGRARTGLLPDGFPFPGELNGREVLDLVARLRGVRSESARERRALVDGWIERVGLTAAGRRATRRYSTGMKRRLALACALIHEPAVLLLDEPGAGLDAEGFEVLAAALDERLGAGTAVVLCSHHGSELFRHCDRIAVLIDGTSAWEGPAAELARRASAIEVEIEFDGADANGDDSRSTDSRSTGERLAEAASATGGRLVATRPSSASTARLFADLARARDRA
ncbi:putative ABC transporter ATP-binding protein YxlF [Planctomycetes bacterium Pla163]|uniref:Putative ABC transporter ATP-binding protein YxlF n=1 Tax=Rohdeia mirabilis TaxID=2528008 RepID=A0A518D2E1_9BACT|nr:putative ABC transporter ATP-binding protein YxlF [Planctomycetes bacterium Pla163]